MRSASILVSLVVATAAGSAQAQYVVTPQSGVPYPALTSGTPITLTGVATTPASDVGRATVSIPFSFPFYGNRYTSVVVHANGFLVFEPLGNAMGTYDTNMVIPNTTEPNAFIAPFWDDLIGDNPGSAILQQAVSGPYGQGLAIEWKNWNRKFTQHDLTFQVRLWANGMMEIYYGTMVGSGATPTATIGIEAPGGVIGLNGLASCATNACALRDFDPGSTGVRISYLRFGPPAGADLQGSELRIEGISEDAGVMTITTRVSMRNFGTLDAGSFTYRLRLGTSTVPAAEDILVQPDRQGPFTLGSLQTLVHTAQSTFVRPDGGEAYYVLAELDDQQQLAETLENNNLVATPVPLAAGVDLVAERVVPPPLVGPNETVNFAVSLSNQGFEAAGAVRLKFYASVDAIFDVGDTALGTHTLNVVGGQTLTGTSVPVTIPGTLRNGEYYVIMDVDDANAIVERSETNNRVFSAQAMRLLQADLVLEDFQVQQPVSPFDATRTAFFGEPIRFEVTIKNQGGARVVDGGVAFFLSDNETLNGVSDTRFGDLAFLNLPPGDSQRVSGTFNVPTRSVSGQLLQRAAYFMFAAAIAPGVRESDAANNFQRSEPIVVRSAAANLRPLSVLGPFLGGTGEAMSVTRALANVGSRPASNVKYRYYLSANTIITTQDTLLPIITSSGEVNELAVGLAALEVNGGTDLVRIPQLATPGQQYLGVLLDPDNTIDETEEADNGLAGTLITVSPQSLGLAQDTLPDALLDSPYSVQLVVRGAATATFTARDPSELPPGLTLSSAGVLAGTPTRVGTFSFTIGLESGGRQAQVRRVVRVSSTTATLGITTTLLPAASRTLPYDVTLGVAGGRRPYGWTVAEGALPAGVRLEPEGKLVGTPVGGLGTTSSFTLRVADVLGNVDARAFSVTVVDASPLRIAPVGLPPMTVGVDFVADLTLMNSNNGPVSRPVRWSIVSGALPPGLRAEASVTENMSLSGTPSRPGLYTFRVEAIDAQGRLDALNYTAYVAPAGATFSGSLPAQVTRGTVIDVQFALSPPPPGLRFFLRDGSLPPGLSLDAETGKLSGSIAADAPFRRYPATLVAGASLGEVYSLKPLNVDVVETLVAPRTGCGCGAADGGLLGVLWLVAVARRRRRTR